MTPHPSPPPLLRSNRSFRDFWTGQTISLFGDQVSLLAIPLLAALVLDAGAAQMGLLTAAALAPNLLFSIHLGAWADSRPRRRQLLVAADVGRALLLLTIPLAWALGALTLTQLYLVAFAAGSLGVIFSVAYDVVFVSLLERADYIEGSSLLNASRAASFAAGNSVAGLLVQLVSAPFALLLDACSYLASAFFVGRAKAEEAPPAPLGTGGAGLAVGVRFIARTPLIRASLLATATLNLFNTAFYALLVLYATRELGMGAGAVGLALAAGGIGSLLGVMLTRSLSTHIGLGKALVAAFVLTPAPLLLVPLAGGSSSPAGVVALAEFFTGIGVMVLDVGLGALYAALVPDQLRARVSGAFLLVNYGVRPIGALAGGLLAEGVGLQATMWVTTIGACGGVLWLLPSPMPRLRELPQVSVDAERAA
ncbi:MAG TPA: MFS transporter [Solirubrobacterales bacterium]|nr:MFS transporter [Solirubrobacterales bacterium]